MLGADVAEAGGFRVAPGQVQREAGVGVDGAEAVDHRRAGIITCMGGILSNTMP